MRSGSRIVLKASEEGPKGRENAMSERVDLGCMNRRNFVKGFAAVGAMAAASTLVACGGTAAGSASGSAQSSSQASSNSEYAQGPSADYPADVLVDPQARWEFVAKVEDTGILEGMNWHDGTLWFIDVASSRIFRMNGDQVEVVYEDPDHKAMPNGAKFIDDDTLLICDRALGLCTYTISTGAYEVKTSSYQGEKFLGLNDLVLDGQGGA